MDWNVEPQNQVKVNIEGKTWDVDVNNFNQNFTDDFKISTVFKFFMGKMNECYSRLLTNAPPLDLGLGPYCKPIFDGFTCWGATPAGTTAQNSCPDFIADFDGTQTVSKRCSEDGTWAVDSKSLKVWTDYSTCVSDNNYSWSSIIHEVFVAGHVISLLALVVSLILVNYVRCWSESSYADWIITVPVIICFLASLMFFGNVVWVLINKLHPKPNRTRLMIAMKMVRAGCILVPLFGIHLLLMLFRPKLNSSNEKVFEIFCAVMTSLQGLYVSILFCFTNQDMMKEVKNQVRKMRRRSEALTMTTASRTTAAENVFQEIREDQV
ncbi:calcitonin receptor-like [Battus philenor]|uniref:calcitonin receptor-like n=1 Tax=Battus philenor TaxID=42288 RepID=UPI0035CF52C0